jgi:hypothetical protein
MSAPRVRLAEAPHYVLHYPTCSACLVDLEHDGDSFQCPKCGTSWDSNAGDGDEGTLYPEWSGEDFDGDQPIVSHDDAPNVPWIEHRYVPWVTDSGYDMRRCHKCFEPKSLHIGGAS